MIDELLGNQGGAAAGSPDLRSVEVLRTLWAKYRREDPYHSWREELTTFLEAVAKADVHERASYELEKRLWDDNPVSSAGQGAISIDKALAEEEFRRWLATTSVEPLPTDPAEIIRHLERLYDALVERLEPVCIRVPRLKIIRVLVAFYPRHLTALADQARVTALHEALLGTRAGSVIARHVGIARRLEEALGPAPEDFEGLAWRLIFPRYLDQLAMEEPRPPMDLAALAHDLLVTESDLGDMLQLLERYRQVIFYGPPGTGKTFVARSLAGFCARKEGTVEIVQFHASYAYEDFVEGYRPTLVNGQPGFRLAPGPLKRLASVAREKPDAPHVLLIDEINRSNIAKVFGELYYLLEYRDDEITLQYSPEQRFRLPANLWIIGTMNTADRSIALVDAALRRRFAFVPFFPDRPPMQGLLARWLARHHPELEWVADLVELANERLKDRHMAIGPSYFMTNGLTEQWVRTIWSHKIVPYLEEYFFDDPGRLKDFELERLREAIAAEDATRE